MMCKRFFSWDIWSSDTGLIWMICDPWIPWSSWFTSPSNYRFLVVGVRNQLSYLGDPTCPTFYLIKQYLVIIYIYNKYIVLNCIILNYIKLHYITLYYIVILHYILLYYIILYYFVILYYITLYYIILHYIILYDIFNI